MDQPTLPMLRNALVRCAIWLAALVAFAYLCVYVSEAHTRHERLPSCRWNVIPNPDNAPYSARWCKLTKDTVVLRLYDATEQHLLAERAYPHFDGPNFYWESKGLGYDSQRDGDLIALPPTLIERVRAKLP